MNIHMNMNMNMILIRIWIWMWYVTYMNMIWYSYQHEYEYELSATHKIIHMTKRPSLGPSSCFFFLGDKAGPMRIPFLASQSWSISDSYPLIWRCYLMLCIYIYIISSILKSFGLCLGFCAQEQTYVGSLPSLILEISRGWAAFVSLPICAASPQLSKTR